MPDRVRDTTKASVFLSAVLSLVFAALEVAALLLALVLLLVVNVPLVLWLSLAIFLLSVYVLITGRAAPRIQSRGKGFAVAIVTSVCLMASAVIYQDQREERLAVLRSTDPDAYLSELQRLDETRWLAELEAVRPGRFESEMQRRELEERAERERERTDRSLGEAYVMIRTDVRQRLHSPATAEFPERYARGTRNESGCIYRILGYVDAQNRFGALLRASFEGRIAYFPDTRLWRTIELTVDD